MNEIKRQVEKEWLIICELARTRDDFVVENA